MHKTVTDLRPAGITTAFSVPDTADAPAAVYMIRGGWAVQHDAASVAPPQRGNTLRELWPKLPSAYLSGFDAACSRYNSPRVYLFKGSTSVLYDVQRNEPVGGASPVPIGDRFPGLRQDAPAFTEGIDAGLPAFDGAVHLFRRDRCVLYAVETDEVLDHAAIAEYWRNPDHPDSEVYGGVAAAFSHPAVRNGYLVAPGGTRYVECDTDRHRVTSGGKVLRDRWPYRTFLSVIDGERGGLWVFDTDSGQKIRQSQIGQQPGGVAIPPDGFRALATVSGDSGGEGSLALLDITSGTVERLAAGTRPYRVTALPDGSAAYVTNPYDGKAHAIDLTTGAKRSIDVGRDPHGIVASPDSRHVYVGCDDNPAVAVVDTATHLVVRRIGGNSTASDMALTPDGMYLGFGERPTNGVLVTPTGGGGEPPHVPVGQSPDQLAASPDSRYLYVANRGAQIKVIDVVGAVEVQPPINVRDRTTAVAVSPDGEHLFITGFGADSVEKLTLPGGEKTDEFPLGAALGNDAYLTIGPAWG